MEITSAEQNYVFNTKKPIPQGMKIAFKDGNEENIKMANLKLVPVEGKEVEPAPVASLNEQIPEEPKKKSKKK